VIMTLEEAKRFVPDYVSGDVLICQLPDNIVQPSKMVPLVTNKLYICEEVWKCPCTGYGCTGYLVRLKFVDYPSSKTTYREGHPAAFFRKVEAPKIAQRKKTLVPVGK
jgi:hypothetical protein